MIAPTSLRTIVSDGRHNAFAGFVKWKGEYWLSHRSGTGHIARDGDVIVRRSTDTHAWDEALRFDILGDDRDPQLLPTASGLRLYINSLEAGQFRAFVSTTDDGTAWSPPRPVYEDGYILWKPVAHDGRFYAAAHRPGSDEHREAHLVTSTDGLVWEKVSTIRAGRGESETTLVFAEDGHLIAFLRSQVTVGGFIMESSPPYVEWQERPAAVHLSGHAAATFDDVTYLIGRHLAYTPPVDPATPRSQVVDHRLDQGTVAYVYEDGQLRPYCQLGPLEGNHDSSYAAAVRDGDDMLVVFHRAAHEYAGEYEARDGADIYLARVPLRQG